MSLSATPVQHRSPFISAMVLAVLAFAGASSEVAGQSSDATSGSRFNLQAMVQVWDESVADLEKTLKENHHTNAEIGKWLELVSRKERVVAIEYTVTNNSDRSIVLFDANEADFVLPLVSSGPDSSPSVQLLVSTDLPRGISFIAQPYIRGHILSADQSATAVVAARFPLQDSHSQKTYRAPDGVSFCVGAGLDLNGTTGVALGTDAAGLFWPMGQPADLQQCVALKPEP